MKNFWNTEAFLGAFQPICDLNMIKELKAYIQTNLKLITYLFNIQLFE